MCQWCACSQNISVMEINVNSHHKYRDLRYDVLRIIAALSVVLLHVVAELGKNVNSTLGMVCLFINSMTRPCVPLFFMLTGAFMLKKKIEIPVLLKSKVLKYFLYFLSWSLAYMCFNSQLWAPNISIVSFFALWLDGEYHLWFLLSLCAVYLIQPLLYAIVHYADGKYIPYYLVCFFVFGLIIPELTPYVWHFFKIKIDIILPDICGYSGYAILGYYLANTWKRKISVKWLVLAFAIATLFPFIVNWSIAYFMGKIRYCSFGYLMFSTAVKAIVLFLLCQRVPQRMEGRPWVEKWVYRLSVLTFGLYLVHPFVISICLPIWKPDTLLSEIICVPVSFIVVMGLSILLCSIIICLPYIKKLILTK